MFPSSDAIICFMNRSLSSFSFGVYLVLLGAVSVLVFCPSRPLSCFSEFSAHARFFSYQPLGPRSRLQLGDSNYAKALKLARSDEQKQSTAIWKRELKCRRDRIDNTQYIEVGENDSAADC